MPILYNNEGDIQENFVSDDEYLNYKYISEIELIALEYLEKNNYNQAVSFYTSVCRQKNVDKVTKHLTELRDGYSKYLFERQTPAVLVSYSE